MKKKKDYFCFCVATASSPRAQLLAALGAKSYLALPKQPFSTAAARSKVWALVPFTAAAAAARVHSFTALALAWGSWPPPPGGAVGAHLCACGVQMFVCGSRARLGKTGVK